MNSRAFPSSDPSAGPADHAGCPVSMDDEDEEASSKSNVVSDRRAAARKRQIEIGKGRPEYARYLFFVPKDRRTPTRPRTPDPAARVSKRQFDRQLSEWRRLLHEYDDPDAPAEDDSGGAEGASRPSQGMSSRVPRVLPPSVALLSDYRQLTQNSGWPSMYAHRSPEVSIEACLSDASSSSGTSSSAARAGRVDSSVSTHAPSLRGSGYGAHSNVWEAEGVSHESASSSASRSTPCPYTLSQAPLAVDHGSFSTGARTQRGLQKFLEKQAGNTGSQLRASCHEASRAPPGAGGLMTSNFVQSSDPSEPMKVFDFCGIKSSEPLQVIPSFDGNESYSGRGAFECARNMNGHSKIPVDANSDCPVTL